MQVGMAKRSIDGGPHCGDACRCWRANGKTVLCMADGLGHGEEAEAAANAAVDYVRGHLSEPLASVFRGCDAAISHTRGVAMGIAVIDDASGSMGYAGIGNIRAKVFGRPGTSLPNGNGIVGAGYKSLTTETVRLTPGDLVVLASDGLAETLDVSRDQSAPHIDLDLLAARLIDDFGRTEDDAAVLVALYGGS